jgi:hypothetical protein
MHGIGEFRFANGRIYKGSFANDQFHGMGLLWLPNGNLYQGYYKDDKMEDLQIIDFKATGDSAYVEYKENFMEGLFAFHKSDGIIWSTYSKD